MARQQRLRRNSYLLASCKLLHPHPWRIATSHNKASLKIFVPRHFTLFLSAFQHVWQPLYALGHQRPWPRHAHLRLERRPNVPFCGHGQTHPFPRSEPVCDRHSVFLSADLHNQHLSHHDAKLHRCYRIPLLLKAHKLQ